MYNWTVGENVFHCDRVPQGLTLSPQHWFHGTDLFQSALELCPARLVVLYRKRPHTRIAQPSTKNGLRLVPSGRYGNGRERV